MPKGTFSQRPPSPGHSGAPANGVFSGPEVGKCAARNQAQPPTNGTRALTYRNGSKSNSPVGSATRPTEEHSSSEPWTIEDDNLLRFQYPLGKKSATAAITQLQARHPDWTRRDIAERARALGLRSSRPAQRQQWDRGSDLALLSLARQPKELIARRLGRTIESVVARLRRLGKSADFFGGFKTKELMEVLQAVEADVRRWQRHGWIRRRRGRITEASLSVLCKEHPAEIGFEKLPPETQYWLVAVHGYPRSQQPQKKASPTGR